MVQTPGRLHIIVSISKTQHELNCSLSSDPSCSPDFDNPQLANCSAIVNQRTGALSAASLASVVYDGAWHRYVLLAGKRWPPNISSRFG